MNEEMFRKSQGLAYEAEDMAHREGVGQIGAMKSVTLAMLAMYWLARAEED